MGGTKYFIPFIRDESYKLVIIKVQNMVDDFTQHLGVKKLLIVTCRCDKIFKNFGCNKHSKRKFFGKSIKTQIDFFSRN